MGAEMDVAVAALIKRTRTDRGLPEKIDDPVVIRKIASILTGGSITPEDARELRRRNAALAARDAERAEAVMTKDAESLTASSAATKRRSEQSAVYRQPESFYRDELALIVRGRTEVNLGITGRCDILTTDAVFEVEPAQRWTHGLRQVIAYSVGAGLPGHLAVFGAWGAEGLNIYLKIRDSRAEVTLWLRSKSGRWRRVTSAREARLVN